jgi:hypothetical protein
VRESCLRILRLESLETRRLLAGVIEVESGVWASPVAAYMAEGEPEHHEHAGAQYVGGHHDPYLPNFAHPAHFGELNVVHSRSAGSWQEVLGTTGANDLIILHHDVTISGTVQAHTIVVTEHGSLTFSRDLNAHLTVVTLQVLQGGLLDIGSETSPIDQVEVEIVFRDAPINLQVDPAQYGNGLLVHGTVTMHGRALNHTFMEVDGEIQVGQTSLELKTEIRDWQPGDQLLIPDTRQLFYTADVASELNQYERLTLATSAAGSLEFLSPARFAHRGGRDASGELAFSPHVANLSRNIVLRSENPTGVRAHSMFLGRADVDARFVEFRDLGRTTNETLDSTVFDSLGRAVYIGSNQVGRYPIHLHQLIGPTIPQANGQQYTFSGNAIHGEVPVKWGIAIHGAHYGLISDNVLYNFEGSGIATEDGSESYNRIVGNFISRIGGNRDRGKFTDGREGSGIWLRRPNNYVNDNVVTGAVKAAYAFYGGDNTPHSAVRIPAYQGADPQEPGGFKLVLPETMVLQSFDNNKGYASHMGLELWYMGFNNYYNASSLPVEKTVVSDLSLWHINHTGIFGIQVNNFEFRNTSIVGDAQALMQYNYQVGAGFESVVETAFHNPRIENYRIGINAPLRSARLGSEIAFEDVVPFTVDGGRLFNQNNILVTTPSQDAFTILAPRSSLFKNIDFGSAGGPAHPLSNIVMDYRPGRFTNLTQLDVVQVENYDLQGLDFRLFYSQQEPEFVVPQSGSLSHLGGGSPLGAPLAGLTNRQAWEQFRIAIAGAVAPGGASHYARLKVPGVTGLAFPKNVAFLPPSLDAISPDTGNPGDFISASGQVVLQGTSQPGSEVDIYWNGTIAGTSQTDENGRWLFDFGAELLPSGTHVFVLESRRGAERSGLGNANTVFVRSHYPTITQNTFSVHSDAKNGDTIGNLLVSDKDANDSYVAIAENGTDVFNIDASTGVISLQDSTRLQPGQSYSLIVHLRDSAGLETRDLITVEITRRPPGEWVTRLTLGEFGRLTPEEVVFLTPAQIRTIPNYYWFSQMSAAARAALLPVQVQAINVYAEGMLALLTAEQREFLSPSQIRELRFYEFRFLSAAQIPVLLTAQIASIPDPYWLAQVSATARDALQAAQIEAFNVRPVGMVSLLNAAQRELLTPGQIQSLTVYDFRYLSPAMIAFVTSQQLADIPDGYWFAQISGAARAALSSAQILGLNLQREGMIGLLSTSQRQVLSDTQIRTLRNGDFQLLPDSRVALLSDAQLYSIPNSYWYFQFSAGARAALLQNGVRWEDGIGIVINRPALTY